MRRFLLLSFFVLLLSLGARCDDATSAQPETRAVSIAPTNDSSPAAAEAVESTAENASSFDPLAGIDDQATLSQLLQWSLNHTDLDALHERAEAVRAAQAAAGTALPQGVLSAEGNEGELPPAEEAAAAAAAKAARKAELNELYERMTPNVVALMREELALAANDSVPLERREAALLELQDHVEDLDNARDFMLMKDPANRSAPALDGYRVIIAHLSSEHEELRAAAAWVLGTAAKNQPEVQLHALELGGLRESLRLIASESEPGPVRGKALYSAAALLRNCVEAQAAFYQGYRGEEAGGEGEAAVTAALRDRGSPNLVRKALALVTDLVRESRHREGAGAGEGEGSGGEAGRWPMGEAMQAMKGVQVGADGAQAAAPEGGASAEGAEGAPDLRAAASSLSNWQDAAPICEAVVLGLNRMGELDIKEKALQAMEQVLLGEMLSASASRGSVCDVASVRTALARYRARCAVGAGELQREDPAGCEELRPQGEALDAMLAELVDV